MHIYTSKNIYNLNKKTEIYKKYQYGHMLGMDEGLPVILLHYKPKGYRRVGRSRARLFHFMLDENWKLTH